MSPKDNFNKAVFDMFGVGSDPAAASSTPVQENIQERPADAFRPVAPPRAVTYLAPGTVLEGRITARGDVEVAGEVQGDISATGSVLMRADIAGNISAAKLEMLSCALTGDVHTTGQVVMDRDSSITGNITAGELVCSGKIKGDLRVNGNSTFRNGALVEGNITTDTMVMEQGAIASGKLMMNGPKAPRAEPAPQMETGAFKTSEDNAGE